MDIVGEGAYSVEKAAQCASPESIPPVCTYERKVMKKYRLM
jgi:hypothetical protein